jgi:hypothetical protein
MNEKEMEKVKELLESLDPIIHKHINKITDQYGLNVSLSLITNVATSFIALAVMIIERHDGNVDEFMSVLLREAKVKYDLAHSINKTNILLDRFMHPKAGGFTCTPPTKH